MKFVQKLKMLKKIYSGKAFGENLDFRPNFIFLI